MKSVHSTGGEAFNNRCHLSIKRPADVFPESVYYGFMVFTQTFLVTKRIFHMDCLVYVTTKCLFSWWLAKNFFHTTLEFTPYYMGCIILHLYRIDFLYGLSWSWESHRCLLSWMLVINFFPHSLQINFSSPTCWRMCRLSPSSCSYVLGHHWHLQRNKNGTEFVSSPDEIPDYFKLSFSWVMFTTAKSYPAYYEHLSNKWLSTFEISAVQLRSVTEIAPK